MSHAGRSFGSTRSFSWTPPTPRSPALQHATRCCQVLNICTTTVLPYGTRTKCWTTLSIEAALQHSTRCCHVLLRTVILLYRSSTKFGTTPSIEPALQHAHSNDTVPNAKYCNTTVPILSYYQRENQATMQKVYIASAYTDSTQQHFYLG